MTTLDAPATATLDPATLDRAAFAREWEDWHRDHEARRADVFAQFHTADEHIPVDALYFSARVTQRLLRNA